MASPSKRARGTGDAESETVCGYLHNVSSVKLSKSNIRYFDATLQTGHEEFRRVVCFSPDKRAACYQASDNKQAVKLVDCSKSISQSDAGGFDVLLHARSRVEAALDVPFGHREQRPAEKQIVAEILKLGPRQKVGSVDVRIMQATGTRFVPLNGEAMEVAEFAVCDRTGQTSLSVWGPQIVAVQEGRSYRIEGLSTRKHGDATVLTTTPTTTVSAIAEVGEPSSITPVPACVRRTVSGQVTGVQILAIPRCRSCRSNQQNLTGRSSRHRCERCGILQPANAYTYSYSGVLLVQGDGPEFSGTLTNSAVFRYVRDNFLSASAHDGSVLEEHVMGCGEVELATNGEGLVLSVAPLRPPEPVAPAAEGEDGLGLEELFAETDDV